MGGTQGGVPPAGIGYSPHRDGIPPSPGTGQQMEYLIWCSRYASCIHAGGLFYFVFMSVPVLFDLEVPPPPVLTWPGTYLGQGGG